MDEITRLRRIIIEAFDEGLVCSRCGAFFDGLKYSIPPRTGCRSDKFGLHQLYGRIKLPDPDVASVRESVGRLICSEVVGIESNLLRELEKVQRERGDALDELAEARRERDGFRQEVLGAEKACEQLRDELDEAKAALEHAEAKLAIVRRSAQCEDHDEDKSWCGQCTMARRIRMSLDDNTEA
jgi:hypothetical protein